MGVEDFIDDRQAEGIFLVNPANFTDPAVKHYAALAKVLKDTPDGALNPGRFPWCKGQDSADPAKPALIAGCANRPGGDE